MLSPDESKVDGAGSYLTPRGSTEIQNRVTRRSEEIHIRNFDVSRDYDLTIEVRDADSVVFSSRYHLTPGKTVSEFGQLSPGTYEVYVELDGHRQQTVRCEVDEWPDQTVLVEVGNGTVSVTEGLYP
ncbi:hypothetical protein ACFQJ7_07830 [Halovenus rubra]|uniref:Ig-like domain-containing protein n=2 Tax=Halovenus rubra TaxID=869890 RepID=A0ABD5X631_9EURY|nr:hypothetical protein [Halovenus rubra]